VLFAELFAKPGAELEAHDENSGEEEDKGGVVRVVVEVSEMEEDESDEEVQEAPQDIDDWRGQSFAGRFREGSGEWFSGDAFDEVRDGVREERSGEEGGDVGVPGHGWDFSKGVINGRADNRFPTQAKHVLEWATRHPPAR
jgi:hypothetical protein